MNWDDLRYVLAAYDAGSLTSAAKKIGVNSSTMSRRLRSLEEQTQTSLFVRLRDGIELTQVGMEFVEIARGMQDLALKLEANASGEMDRIAGKIRVTSTDVILSHWMKDFARFSELYPAIELELLSPYELANLTRREADVALRTSVKAPDHLIGRRHAGISLGVYGTHELIRHYDHSEKYADYPWVSWDLSVYRGTDEFLKAHVGDVRITTRLDRVDLIVQALKEGMGITVLPCMTADTQPDLKRIGDYQNSSHYLWILYHKELRQSLRVRTFVDFVNKLAIRDRDLMEGRCSLP